MAMLDISGISVRFGGLKALSRIDLSLKEGEIYGLIGTNGAGKTTLFNTICGFITPESGSIRFRDQDITGWSPVRVCRVGIGRCFQTVKPFRSMTPLENVRVSRAYGRKADGERQLSLEEILDITGLSDKKHVLTEYLTLPDKKNVEIARALAGNPRLILFDEVASGLTGKEIQGRVSLIKRLSQAGLTFIVVEHIMKFIKEICDRVGVLHAGEMICEGAPEEVAREARVIDAYLGGKKS